MFKIFYADKDATIFESNPTYNTGLDEILEIGKRYGTDGETLEKSRALVKFNMTEISASLAKYNKTVNDCKFNLQLYTTYAKEIPAEYEIETKLIAQNWTPGTGFISDPSINGVSWNYPSSGSMWISSSQNIQIGSSTLYISGSGDGGSWMYQSNVSGSTAGLTASQSFSYQTTDINLDVTDSMKIWLSGSDGVSIPNYGFLLKLSDTVESDNNVASYINFFSKDTHTIYVPKLVMYWDNSTFTTGSLTQVNTESYLVYTDVKPSYKDTEISKIRIYARDKYPRKSATNLFPIQTVKYLPTTTYYTVLDAATDEVIIPYDNIYTKVSCDSTSNFIYLDFNGFMPERYYRLELKIVNGIEEHYVTDQIYFKITR
jgi:hypothetical protein